MSHLIWLYTESPLAALDAATWLETTRELETLGWKVTLVVAGDTTGWQDMRGVRVYTIERSRAYIIGLHRFHMQFYRLASEMWDSLDVIMFHQMSAPWVFLLRLKRFFQRRQLPLVVMDNRTLHMTTAVNTSLRDQVRRLYYNITNKTVTWWADGQLAITRRLAEAVGIPTSKLWGIWTSGVTQEHYSDAWTERAWPGENEPIKLIYTGSLHHERNLMTFCKAVEAASAKGMKFHMTILGSGTEQEELAAFAATTSGRIQVLPPVPYSEVAGYLKQHHVGVLPFPDEQKFRVSSPIKLFEYMASGMIIMATHIVCHTDVIQDGEFVMWANGSDENAFVAALTKLWEQRRDLPRLGQLAGAASSQWTWHESAKRLSAGLEYGLSQIRQGADTAVRAGQEKL